jgi:hypothetical protein
MERDPNTSTSRTRCDDDGNSNMSEIYVCRYVC